MTNLTDKEATPPDPTGRILGDLRIFQAVHNDLKLKHEVVTIEDGKKRWAYTYEGIDPYDLEDYSFPTIMAAIEAYTAEQVRLARIDELTTSMAVLEVNVLQSNQYKLRLFRERLAQLQPTPPAEGVES